MDHRSLRINTWLPVPDVSFMHGRGTFFALSQARVIPQGFMKYEALASSDDIFGVRIPIGVPVRRGVRYRIDIEASLPNIEYILLGDKLIYEKPPEDGLIGICFSDPEQSMAGFSARSIRLRAVAERDDPELYIVRDKARFRYVETVRGRRFMAMQAEDYGRHTSEWCEVDDELVLPLLIRVRAVALCDGPEDNYAVGRYSLPQGLRFFKGPEIYHRFDTSLPADSEPGPYEPAAYAADPIELCEREDLYGGTREPEDGGRQVEDLDEFFGFIEKFGVTDCRITDQWSFKTDAHIVERFIELCRQGRGGCLRRLHFVFGGPPVEQELGEAFTRGCCRTIGRMLDALPDRTAVIRIMELTTNGQWNRPRAVPEYLRPPNCWNRDLYELENSVIPAALADYFDRLRRCTGHPDRTLIAVQGDGPAAGAHWKASGIDYFMTKNIHGFNTNIVQAVGRGYARAFGAPVGLAYDSHRAMDYEGVCPAEVRHVYLSYFFSGMDRTMYEAPFYGFDRENRLRLTRPGAEFYRLFNWMRRHPARGEEIIRIGFIKGSEDFGLRIPGPGPTRHGNRHRLLMHENPACMDWNLLDIVYPKFGDYEGSDPARYVTGSPHGQTDILPHTADISLLKNYDILVFMGKNRMARPDYDKFLAYVKQGGTLVCALEHFQAEDQRRRKYVDWPLSGLLGVELGEDVFIGRDAWNEWVPSRTRFYNRVQAGPGARFVHTMRGGDPLLIRHAAGRGETWFFTTEYLSGSDPSLVRGLLERKFAGTAAVALTPACDWLQWFVRRRDGILSVAVLNHGQAGFPQGLGEKAGVWEGEARVNLKGLIRVRPDLRAWRLRDDFTLEPARARLSDERLEFAARVDEWAEYYIGGGDTAEILFSTNGRRPEK